jgi:hypothetical protein
MRALRLRNITRRAIVIAVSVAAVATVADAGERWQWSITPYMWATDISEDVLLNGTVVGGGDTEFDDLVDIVEASYQLHFEGMREHWGMFADVNYVDLSDSATGEYGLARLDVDYEEMLLEAGALCRPGGRSGNLDLIVGVRALTFDERYRLQVAGGQPREVSVDEDYVDFLIGARYNIPLSQRWVISLRGDVSTGGTDHILTAQGLLAWRFGAKRNSAIFAGYRYRDMKYRKADVLVDEKTLAGFGVGVRFGF